MVRETAKRQAARHYPLDGKAIPVGISAAHRRTETAGKPNPLRTAQPMELSAIKGAGDDIGGRKPVLCFA